MRRGEYYFMLFITNYIRICILEVFATCYSCSIYSTSTYPHITYSVFTCMYALYGYCDTHNRTTTANNKIQKKIETENYIFTYTQQTYIIKFNGWSSVVSHNTKNTDPMSIVQTIYRLAFIVLCLLSHTHTRHMLFMSTLTALHFPSLEPIEAPGAVDRVTRQHRINFNRDSRTEIFDCLIAKLPDAVTVRTEGFSRARTIQHKKKNIARFQGIKQKHWIYFREKKPVSELWLPLTIKEVNNSFVSVIVEFQYKRKKKKSNSFCQWITHKSHL